MPSYGGYAADMDSMDAMDRGLMAEGYPSTLHFERQPYA